ncbi:MAG TPA: MDR family MFS transporter [Bacillota bacterium]|nr:MDR family MFS transporter [Bacillota bacterium]
MTSHNLSPLYRRLIVATTLSAAFLSVLTQFLLLTAFPKIMDEFTINSTQVQWLTTSFMLTAAVFIPITAYFIDRFQTRTLMMGAMFLFTLGTLIGLVAPSFPVLIVGRVVQGIGSGVMIPLMQTVLFLLYPREKRGFAMGLAGMVINVAPAIGPPISGILIKYFEWRALFYLILPIAVCILLMVFFFMRNVTKQRKTEIDIASILLSSVGFGGMLYGFNQLEESGITHTATLVSLVVGAVSLCWFIIRQLRIDIPILEMRVLKVPIFALVAVISIIGFSLLISIETILPLYIQNAQQFSAYYSGLIVMPGALTLAIMSRLGGRLFDKYGGRTIAIIGFIMLAASTICFHFLLEMDTSFIIPVVLFMISMGGVALINMPIMTTGINALPDELIPHGTSVINTARQFGGSLGLTFIISFITKAQAETGDIQPLDYLDGIKTAFFVAFIFAVTGLVLSFLVKKKEQDSD